MTLLRSEPVHQTPPEFLFLCATIKRAVEDVCLDAEPHRPKQVGRQFIRQRKLFERERRKARLRKDAMIYLFSPDGLERDLRCWKLHEKININYIRRKAKELMGSQDFTEHERRASVCTSPVQSAHHDFFLSARKSVYGPATSYHGFNGE